MDDDHGNDEAAAPAPGRADAALAQARRLAARIAETPPRVLWLLLVVLAAVAVALAVWGSTRGSSPASSTGTEVVTADAPTFWTDLDKRHALPQAIAGPEGESALQLKLHPGRKFFTILQKVYDTPLDWRGRPYFLLNYRGTGGGGTLQLVVDFASNNGGFAVYNLHDTTPKWRQLAFSTSTADAHNGKLRWGHVVGFRLVGDKHATAEIAVGELKVAQPTRFGP